MNIRAIVTDIEGTTSSIAFVHEVLFPYASRMLPDYIRTRQQDDNIRTLLQETRAEAGETDAGLERTIDILLQWIREDRKATPLKALQGLVWEQGFERGDFTGHVYEDASRKLQEWHQAGFKLYVYSSGSVYAQQLFFGHSDAGDLLHLFEAHFDTTIGHKREPESYRAIAAAIGMDAGQILFLSDVAEELDAAAEAGMRTVQLVRDDSTVAGSHTVVHDFDQLVL